MSLKKEWWKEAVVYQVYPRSFKDSSGNGVGDIRGIIEKLDYIKDLGVDVIWLNPVYDSPNDDNGYDISNYQVIHPEFGTMEDWEELLYEMHKRGLKLIMDLVVNHTSDEHNWFIKSRESKDSKYRNYYHWVKTEDGKAPNSCESFFSGSVWEKDVKSDEYYLHLFSKKQPDLNWENPEVRNEVYSMMKWWLDKGIDGFRMDVISFISKKPEILEINHDYNSFDYANGPKLHDYLQEMNKNVLSKYDIMTVGECPGATVENAHLYVGEDRNELNMLFNFDHMDADVVPGYGKWSINSDKMYTLKKILSKWQVGMRGRGWNSIYLMNHDQPRAISRFGSDSKEFREVSGKMLITLTMSLQGTPYIYMGEEIGMTNINFNKIQQYRDIETLNFYSEQINSGKNSSELMEIIKYRSRDNSRTPMQWDSSSNAGSTTGSPWIDLPENYKEINVENAINSEDSILAYYKNIIKLRKNTPALIYGDFKSIDEENKDLFIYVREYEGRSYLIILNMTDKIVKNDLKNLDFSESKELISNYNSSLIIEGGEITLNPFEARIFSDIIL